MLSIQVGAFPEQIDNWIIWLYVGLSAAVVLAFYVLRSIGIYTLAKRQGLKRAILAWIPCVWVYTACKLVGETNFFGKPLAKLALLLCIVFTVGEVLSFTYEFLYNFPIVGNFLAGRELYMPTSLTPESYESHIAEG